MHTNNSETTAVTSGLSHAEISPTIALLHIERDLLISKVRENGVRFALIASLEHELLLRDARIGTLEQEAFVRDTRIGTLEQDVHLRDARIGALEQDVHYRDARIGALEQDVRYRDARIGALEQDVHHRDAWVAALEQDVHYRDARIESLNQEVHLRDVRIEALEQTVHHQDGQIRHEQARLHAELSNARISVDTAEQRSSEISQHLSQMRISTSWRITAPVRKILEQLSPRRRNTLRRAAKLVYWLATPHRIPERLRFLKARGQVLPEPLLPQGAVEIVQPPVLPPEPPVLPPESPVVAPEVPVLPIEEPPTAPREHTVWFFVGDTIEWLRTHDRITGVGRVTCELFMASLRHRKPGRFVPCVASSTPSGLASVSYWETALFLSNQVGVESVLALIGQPDVVIPVPVEASYPHRGDHVVFTGVVWNRHYADLFVRLAERGIRFSVLIHDIIPIEEPDLVGAKGHADFVEWLTTTVALASVIYVSNPFVREQLFRWSILAGQNIAADVVVTEFGANNLHQCATTAELRGQPALTDIDFGSFVLSVGTIDTRKNQILLCRVWSILASELGPEHIPQLVLVGRDDLDLIGSDHDFANLITTKKIVILQGLSDAELSGLYRESLFTAFPSLSEGYGLPVAESLQMGKLCLAADLPAIRAHAGDLPWYFDSSDQAAALSCLRKAITEPALVAAAERRIATEYKPRSWVSTFDAILTALGPLDQTSKSNSGVVPKTRAEPPYLPPISLPKVLRESRQWCASANPDVSILVINWNASEMTLECVRQVWANTDRLRYEIIIADNGSNEENLRLLRPLSGVANIKVLELGCNRYFGEANNIAAEHATGRYLCLLNNDAFVQKNWITELVDSLEGRPEVGGVGPLFLFPNGRIQEAGAVIDAGGFPIRFGRDESADDKSFYVAKFVDYISAAAFLLPRELFMQIGGFDLTYEPAYYEDTDLCFKLHALGKKVLFCPTAVVVHIEGASTPDDPVAVARRTAMGDLNREKFLARWGTYLRTRNPDDAKCAGQSFLPVTADRGTGADRTTSDKTAVIYTPYDITPGGGERYILTVAGALSEDFAVTIVTPHPYSSLRLRAIGVEFGLDLSRCAVMPIDQFRGMDRPDIMVTMGNHIVPPIELLAKRGIYLCQFPFPLSNEDITKSREALSAYSLIVVYSKYAKAHVQSALSAYQLPPIPIMVIQPPVPQITGCSRNKKNRIVAVGRFFVGGHNKRHDLMIEAFRTLVEGSESGAELHLAGSSMPHPAHLAYLESLKVMAKGLDVFFHVNASKDDLHQIYRDAAIYWHATGMNVDLDQYPEQAEHFGISLVEAMSAGCVPLAFNAGGPREIIQHGVNGYLYNSPADLIRYSIELLAPENAAMRIKLGEAARQRAAIYSDDCFRNKVRKLGARYFVGTQPEEADGAVALG